MLQRRDLRLERPQDFGRQRDYNNRFGARLRQAISMTRRSVDSSTALRRTEVLPRFPHAPLAGAKAFALARTNLICSSGGRMTMP